mmetsp:Transcript_24366/g.45744  ORF Transcript_24366/g.45744 Transcript_24366/m.45744 type:complete len:205 (-) Transcript_24366:164-778(-)
MKPPTAPVNPPTRSVRWWVFKKYLAQVMSPLMTLSAVVPVPWVPRAGAAARLMSIFSLRSGSRPVNTAHIKVTKGRAAPSLGEKQSWRGSTLPNCAAFPFFLTTLPPVAAVAGAEGGLAASFLAAGAPPPPPPSFPPPALAAAFAASFLALASAFFAAFLAAFSAFACGLAAGAASLLFFFLSFFPPLGSKGFPSTPIPPFFSA